MATVFHYLDNNATTALDGAVLESMLPWMTTPVQANASSLHRAGVEARVAIERARRSLAGLLNAARPEDVVFTSSGTEALNLALRGLVDARWRPGDAPVELAIGAIEHKAVIDTARALEATGRARVVWLPCDAEGRYEPDIIAARLSPATALVALMHANNEVGTVQPIRDLVGKCREATPSGVVLVDAVQTLGKVPVDVAALGADLVAVAAHKLYGPGGAAALIVRQGLAIAPQSTGGHQEHGLRAGTENVAAIVGFAEAARRAVDRLPEESRRLSTLRDMLARGLAARIDGLVRNTPAQGGLPNTLNVSVPGLEGRALVRALDDRGFGVSAGSACTSTGEATSHVLSAMFPHDEVRARGAVRISLGRDTTAALAAAFVEAMIAAVKELRGVPSR